MISAETLIAYVDGELDEAGRADVEAAATKDKDIAAQIEAHKALRVNLMTVFAPVAEEPMPQAFLDVLEAKTAPPATILPFRPRIGRPAMVQIGAMAASLVAGIGLTLLMTQPGGDFMSGGNGLVARGELARALSAQLASDTVTANAPHIGLTFRDKAGSMCRTFETARNEGLACRKGKAWRIDVAARATQKTEYTQAGSPMIMQAVEERIDGDPLGADAERAARDGGWKR